MKSFLRGIIRFYQLFFSPVLGRNCRFYPSCSEYAKAVLSRHSLGRGLFLGFKRILRCHPFHPGGVDLP